MTFNRSGAQKSNVYKRNAFVISWRFHNRVWQPQRHDRLPETSGTLWIHRGALTNQRCSLATGCGITPKASRYTPPHRPYPLSVLIRRPSLPPTTLCPRLPPPPSSQPGPSAPFQWHSLSTTPYISVPRPPPTLVPSFTVYPPPPPPPPPPPCPRVRHPSSRPV